MGGWAGSLGPDRPLTDEERGLSDLVPRFDGETTDFLDGYLSSYHEHRSIMRRFLDMCLIEEPREVRAVRLVYNWRIHLEISMGHLKPVRKTSGERYG